MIRKIETPEELERKRKRNVTIISIILLGVLVVGTLGYAFTSGNQTGVSTNSTQGSVQDRGDGRFLVTIGGYQVLLNNPPSELKNVSVDMTSSINTYSGNNVYIDANNTGIYSDIGYNLARYGAKISQACYGHCAQDLPEKNCSSDIIVWRESSENKVYQNDSCVFIYGDLKAVDAFTYKAFGGA